MTIFIVKSRATTPWKEDTIDAPSRDHAVHQVLDAAGDDMDVEVCSVIEADTITANPVIAPSGAKQSQPHK